MRDKDDRLATLLPDSEELRLHQISRLRINRGEGLIHQKDIRINRQSSRQPYSLPHSS